MDAAATVEVVRKVFEDWNARPPAGPEVVDAEVHWDARELPIAEMQRG